MKAFVICIEIANSLVTKSTKRFCKDGTRGEKTCLFVYNSTKKPRIKGYLYENGSHIWRLVGSTLNSLMQLVRQVSAVIFNLHIYF